MICSTIEQLLSEVVTDTLTVKLPFWILGLTLRESLERTRQGQLLAASQLRCCPSSLG